MVDAVAVWPPGFRFKDASGEIVAGGSVEFYDAGTSNAKTVYSNKELTTALGSTVYLDSGGSLVSAQGGSTKVTVYVGTAAYKVIIKNSSGTTLETKDNLLGAFNSASITDSLSVTVNVDVRKNNLEINSRSHTIPFHVPPCAVGDARRRGVQRTT